MKKKMSLMLAMVLIVSLFSSTVFASNSQVLVDGSNKVIEQEVKGGRTYIATDSLKSFGLETKKTGDKLVIKNKEATITFTLNTNKVKVNNSEFVLDAKSYEKHNKVYLPFRFLFETLNYKVDWNGKSKKVSLTKGKTPSYPVVFENDGNKYKIDKEPRTIVSLAPDITETLFDIGAGSKIKGRTIYCNYPGSASRIREVGSLYDPNIETVIDINPELVMAATHFKVDVLNKFKEAKINIFAKDSPKTLDQMYEFTLVLGNIVNRNYEARALVSSMKAKVQTVEMYTSNLKNKPSVYYVVGAGEYGEFAATGDTFTNDVILAAGGINVASDGSNYSYTLEKLIDKNPKYIFGPQMHYDTMKASNNYRSLQALKNNNFILVNEDIFARPSQRLVDQGLKILLKTLHNDIYKNLDF